MEIALAIKANAPPWRRATVFGLGASGYSSACYLAQLGVAVSVQDSRERPPYRVALGREWPDVPVSCGEFNLSSLEEEDLAVVSPGIALSQPVLQAAAERGLEIVGDIELFARACTAPVVSITGSNGKTTVTTLVGELLKAHGLDVKVGGNIGCPALELLAAPEPDLYVLELSSFQLETTSSLHSAVAAILNISPDHLDRYGTMESYVDAKLRIVPGARSLVLSRDDPALAGAQVRGDFATVTFGLNPPQSNSDYGIVLDSGSEWIVRGSERLVPVATLSLTGRHNLANTLAAIAVVELAGYPLDESGVKALSDFRDLPHRCEQVLERNGIAWVNDSKSTNPGATVAALAGMGRPVVLIAGGQSKDAEFTALAEAVQLYARQVLLIGEDRLLLAGAIGDRAPVTLADDLAHAITLASRWAQPGDVVLLSPGCASFDMFDNFEHRGEIFCRLTREMIS